VSILRTKSPITELIISTAINLKTAGILWWNKEKETKDKKRRVQLNLMPEKDTKELHINPFSSVLENCTHW
jgi:hypothetical protein